MTIDVINSIENRGGTEKYLLILILNRHNFYSYSCGVAT